MKLLTSMALMCAVLFVTAQEMSYDGVKKSNIVTALNLQPIDDSRYEGIDKHPYLFQEFVSAKVFSARDNKVEEYKVNFNGNSQQFEFMHNGVKVVLDDTYYDMIEVKSYTPSEHYSDKYASGSAIFVKGLDPNAPNAFQILLYEDDELAIYKTFDASVSSRTVNDPARGATDITQFAPRFDYFYASDDKSENIRLKRKDVLEVLNDGKMEKYVKKQGWKLKDETELKKALAYYEKMKLTAESEPVAKNDDN